MMVNKKSAIKKYRGIERMQVEKYKGNILTDKDYVEEESKDVNAAMGLQKKQ